ncbi:MAG TPA: LysR family transcriptional regulator [Ramlibacter sp.]|nr:LysR family transcriptional regulator [Ramlibacter sp.]
MPTAETPPLTLKALRTLATVSRARSLTQAATQLGMAQSAVSRHLAELEHALGAALFHRTGRGVQPTDFGAQLLPRVESLLADADALAQAGRELAGTPAGLVTLGLVPGVSGFVAPALHARLRQQCPQVRLRVLEGYSGEMEAALAQGRLDLAVLNRYRARGTNSYRRLFDTPLCVVGRREVLLRSLGTGSGTRRELPATTNLHALAALPLVLPVPPNAIRNLLDELCHRHGLTPRVLLEAGSSVILKGLLRGEDCASVLPRHAIGEELRAGALAAVPLAERAFRQHVVLATSSQRPFTLASKAVAALVPGVVEQALAGLGI